MTFINARIERALCAELSHRPGCPSGAAARSPPTTTTTCRSRPTYLIGSSRWPSPDRVCAGRDTTCIHTDAGGLFPAVDIDLCHRQVVGWSLRENTTRNVVVHVLRIARFKRHPSKQARLICHSVRGDQQANLYFGDVRTEYGITASWADAATVQTTPATRRWLCRCRWIDCGPRWVTGARRRTGPPRGYSGTTRPDCTRRWPKSAPFDFEQDKLAAQSSS